MARRKRNDPDAAPIDGDYTLDQVLNKDPAFTYALVDPDDMAKYQSMGYVAEDRSSIAAHPAWDQGTADTAGYKVRNLTLMKIPKASRARIDAVGLDRAKARMSGIKREFESVGGEFGRPALA